MFGKVHLTFDQCLKMFGKFELAIACTVRTFFGKYRRKVHCWLKNLRILRGGSKNCNRFILRHKLAREKCSAHFYYTILFVVISSESFLKLKSTATLRKQLKFEWFDIWAEIKKEKRIDWYVIDNIKTFITDIHFWKTKKYQNKLKFWKHS